MTDLYIATEDLLSEAIIDRLVLEANQGLRVKVRMGKQGNGYLRGRFRELTEVARNYPVVLLTDLDKIQCPSMLINNWRGAQVLPRGMLFRVAVREVEAWLLADRKGFSEFSSVPLNRLPQNPELIEDPKQLLLNLIRRHGKRDIRAEILPEKGSLAKVGFGYNPTLCQFVRDLWSPVRAAENADSLARTCARLREIARV